jgi:hypothetical protein
MAIELGKVQLEERTRVLNKTYDPDECLDSVKRMWESFVNDHAKETNEATVSQDFTKEYLYKVMEEKNWNITKILTDSSMKAWCGEGKTHMYFWSLFEVTSIGARAKYLEHDKLKRVFDALEYKDANQ